MRADHLSYKRATNVSMLGVAIQVVLGIALLLYGLLKDDSAGLTASFLILLGSAVWIALAIIFDQHRRERLEAVEHENFADQDLSSSSVFDEAQADLRVAAKRLDWLYKFMLPAVSIAMGIALITVGWLRLGDGPQTFVDQSNEGLVRESAQGHHGWAIALGIGIGVIGFVFARFTSGMARAKVWESLRGGSVYSVGSAIFGLALAIAHFADLAGLGQILSSLNTVLCVTMIVLGAEIFLNFVLDIYRPRPAGEYPRPAFDSRLLGFVAAPDRIAESINDAINYQFGYEVTSSWFYRLLSRSFLWLFLLGGVAIWLMSSFAVIEPHQRGLLLNRGEVVRELGPGLHIKAPWPLGQVIVPEFVRTELEGEGRAAVEREIIEETATGVRILELGAGAPEDEDAVRLWTTEGLSETLMVVQPSPEATGNTSRFGRGLSLASVRVPVYYSIKPGGVEAYLRLGTDAETRDSVLRMVAQRELMQELASRSIDDVIGSGRNEIRRSLKDRLSSAFAGLNPDENGNPLGAGVEILFVGLEDASPPFDTAKAFELVFEASQKSETTVINAEQSAAETLAKAIGSVEDASEIAAQIAEYDRLRATGSSDELLEQEIRIREMIEAAGGEAGDAIMAARAERWESHMKARSLSEEYGGKLAAFQAAPEVYETRMRFDAISDAIRNLRLYILDEDSKKHIRLDLIDQYLGSSMFDPQNEGDM
ncbi:MAG: hypothetical protein Phyf2KO_20040 [Phycisphaerales bacterium]